MLIKWNMIQRLPEYGNKASVSAGKIKDLKFKAAAFRIKNLKGKNDNGQIKLDFLPAKYLQKQVVKSYDFASFSNGIAESNDVVNSNYNKTDICALGARFQRT